MAAIAQAYREAGGFAQVATIIAVVGIGLASRRWNKGAWLFCIAPLVVGTVGYLVGISRVDRAVAFADPSMRELLATAGHAEAGRNLWIGGAWAVIACAYNAVMSRIYR